VCQNKEWMDEAVMNKWIDIVHIPWKNAKAPGIIPILILDAYHAHMVGNIVNRIQSLGIEVIHIPAGSHIIDSWLMLGLTNPSRPTWVRNGRNGCWEEGALLMVSQRSPRDSW
jgi:hypothetical protein